MGHKRDIVEGDDNARLGTDYVHVLWLQQLVRTLETIEGIIFLSGGSEENRFEGIELEHLMA